MNESREIPCPNCYGGHFRPCQWCSDTGTVTVINKKQVWEGPFQRLPETIEEVEREQTLQSQKKQDRLTSLEEESPENQGARE